MTTHSQQPVEPADDASARRIPQEGAPVSSQQPVEPADDDARIVAAMMYQRETEDPSPEVLAAYYAISKHVGDSMVEMTRMRLEARRELERSFAKLFGRLIVCATIVSVAALAAASLIAIHVSVLVAGLIGVLGGSAPWLTFLIPLLARSRRRH